MLRTMAGRRDAGAGPCHGTSPSIPPSQAFALDIVERSQFLRPRPRAVGPADDLHTACRVQSRERRRAVEFARFLKEVDAQVPEAAMSMATWTVRPRLIVSSCRST